MAKKLIFVPVLTHPLDDIGDRGHGLRRENIWNNYSVNRLSTIESTKTKTTTSSSSTPSPSPSPSPPSIKTTAASSGVTQFYYKYFKNANAKNTKTLKNTDCELVIFKSNKTSFSS